MASAKKKRYYIKRKKELMDKSISGLRAIDWDFEKSVSSSIHSIHPYPARFIPQIPKNLIEIFHPGDGSAVLDPFCGSGTTIIEAVSQGIDAVGIDLNPLACLIAKVKTTLLPYVLGEVGRRIISDAEKAVVDNSINIPDIPRLDHWFKKDIQKALAALIKRINEEKVVPVKEALQIALSSIIVRVSNQESDTRYAAIEKNVTAKDVFDNFEIAVKNLDKAIFSVSQNLFGQLGKATIINKDVLDVSPRDLPLDIGLVITSPPYPNAYEYWLYHKYRMYWLGMDPVEVRKREIGARPHYSKTNGQDENDFERQMRIVFKLLTNSMRKNGKVCILVGRSIIRGRVIDNVNILKSAGESNGFVVEDVIERNIAVTRKAFNPVYSSINKEHILVFSLVG